MFSSVDKMIRLWIAALQFSELIVSSFRTKSIVSVRSVDGLQDPTEPHDAVFRSIALEELAEAPASQDSDLIINEIERCKEDRSSRRSSNYWEDYRINGGDLILKRLHSFGLERSSASVERMMMTEPAMASLWRYRRGSFWSKRPSPFGSLTKAMRKREK